MAQESKKLKRRKFTTEETAALIEIIGNRRDFDKRKYIGKKKKLEKAWAQITLLFNDAFRPISTPQQLMNKWKRMQMEDKKAHVENKAATGGDLTSKSASAKSGDNLKGSGNDSSSKKGQKGMSVVKESPGPGTNTDISATSQAPGKRIRTGSLTRSDGCSSQNWQDKEEQEKMIEQLSRQKRELEIQKLTREIQNLKDENKESKN